MYHLYVQVWLVFYHGIVTALNGCLDWKNQAGAASQLAAHVLRQQQADAYHPQRAYFQQSWHGAERVWRLRSPSPIRPDRDPG